MSILIWVESPWTSQYLRENGYYVARSGDEWIVTNLATGAVEDPADIAAVEALLLAFDPIDLAQAEKIIELKLEACKRLSMVYEIFGIKDFNGNYQPELAFSLMEMFQDLYLSILPAARAGLAGSLPDVAAIRTAGLDAASVINAMTDWELVVAYDVVSDPAWPA